MKRQVWISIATVLIASFAIFGTHSIFGKSGSADEDQSVAGRWEYLVVQGGNVNLSPSDSGTMRKEPGAFSRESFPLERNLDKLGAKGWELVAVLGSPNDPVFYLKRRK